jgi:hypothetical protein
MGVFDFLFNKKDEPTNLVDCPRCLGKGYVDEQDIKRLKQELRWQPGTCAYCNAKGKVDPLLPGTVPADTSYLTTDLSKDERKKIMRNDPDALKRAKAFDQQFEQFIRDIRQLFYHEHMEVSDIAERILEPYAEDLLEKRTFEKEKAELEKYIQKVLRPGNQAN